MINTIHTKSKRFDGLFHVGDPDAKDVVLMMGSCRGVPHLNFLNTYNEARGKPMSIYYVDPFDFNWDRGENLVGVEKVLPGVATDQRILDIFKRTTIFIHEHYNNFGMFNTSEHQKGNIYEHGMAPALDICLPNFHDRFILFQNILDFDEALRAKWVEGRRDEATTAMTGIGFQSMSLFREMCQRTSFPGFAEYFRLHCKKVRMFYNFNHVSHAFTIPLFRMMSEKFLHLDVDQAFYDGLFASRDLYANANVCPLTQEDVDAHGWEWAEPIKELKI